MMVPSSGDSRSSYSHSSARSCLSSCRRASITFASGTFASWLCDVAATERRSPAKKSPMVNRSRRIWPPGVSESIRTMVAFLHRGSECTTFYAETQSIVLKCQKPGVEFHEETSHASLLIFSAWFSANFDGGLRANFLNGLSDAASSSRGSAPTAPGFAKYYCCRAKSANSGVPLATPASSGCARVPASRRRSLEARGCPGESEEGGRRNQKVRRGVARAHRESGRTERD